MIRNATPEQLLETDRYHQAPLMFLFKNVKGNSLQDSLKLASAILDKLDVGTTEFPLSAMDNKGASAISQAIDAKYSLEELVSHNKINQLNCIRKKYLVQNDGKIDQSLTMKNILEGTKDGHLGMDTIIERIAAKTPEDILNHYAKADGAVTRELIKREWQANPDLNVGDIYEASLSGDNKSAIIQA